MKRLTALSVLAAFAQTASAAISVEIIPAAPKQNEPVHVRIVTHPGDPLFADNFVFARSSVFATPANQFNIIPSGNGQPLDLSPVERTFYLGRLPMGDYTIRIGNPDLAAIATVAFTVGSSSGSRLIAGQPEAASPLDRSGIWYKPSEPGSSIVLMQSPASRDLGGGIYGYRSDHSPMWYTITPGEWLDAELTRYRSPVYRSQGSPLAGPYHPADFASQQVGTVTMTFLGIDTMRVETDFDGMVGTSEYKRFGF